MIYLDHAATSFPRSERVVRRTAWALRNLASPGRGSSRASEAAAELLYRLRETAGAFFECPGEQVVLTTSATHGLNLAIKSIAHRGDRVVVSGMEHNAVMRPLWAMGADIRVARGKLFDNDALLEEMNTLLTGDTKLCVCTHVSNVFGWILPVAEVAALCRSRGIPLIVDASQSAGILPVSMKDLRAAFIAMPGHKGLQGAQGTGLLLCNHETRPLLEGGTGSLSRLYSMPEFLPDRLEPGTPNLPGAAGLLAGMEQVREIGLQEIRKHEVLLRQHFCTLAAGVPGIQLFQGENQSGVVSLRLGESDPVELATILAERWNIATRAGLHCAPLAHETAGTMPVGTLRVSFGYRNCRRDAAALVSALKTAGKM